MIHRRPLAAKLTKPKGYRRLSTPIQCVQRDPFNVRLTPKYISSIPFPTLLLQSLPSKDHEIYGPYNTVGQFIKHMKYDKAELVEVEAVLKQTRKCDVLQLKASSLRTLLNMCIQRSGAGDGPTSVVVEFLLPGPAY